MRDGDFLRLLEQEQGRLYRTALGMMGNPADAADALADAVTEAYAGLGGLRGGASAFAAWMRRIVVNRCCALLRQRRRMTPAGQPEERAAPDPPPGPEELSPGELWAAVSELDDRFRPVLVLHYAHGYSLDEVGRLLDLPPGTVRSRLHRALAQLRQDLAPGPGRSGGERRAGGGAGWPALPDHMGRDYR